MGGKSVRFDTFESFPRFAWHQTGRIVPRLLAFASLVVYGYWHYHFSLTELLALSIIPPLAGILVWRFYHFPRHSRPGYVEISDTAIDWCSDGASHSFDLCNLHDVKLPSAKESRQNADFIHLYFGDNQWLRFDGHMPHFPQIKELILQQIAASPDLQFIQNRISGAAT